jgi:uncharacterized phage protein (TIGR01671 family)
MDNSRFKFRAWDKSQNYMAYQGAPDLETLQSLLFHFGDCPLTQYTGLKDKNGKEIYESDLLKWKGGRITEVTWHKYTASFDCIAHNSNGIARPLSDRVDLYAEIIGNKFENPELLSC